MGAGHGLAVAGSNRVRLGVAFPITATVLAAEVIGAWITGCLALLAATAMSRPPQAAPRGRRTGRNNRL